MLRNSRVIFNDNGTLRDMTVELGDILSGTYLFNYTTSQDYLYIGSETPFNHKYFDLYSVNAVSTNITVEIWTGTQWLAAVDVLDETKVSGVSFAQSGRISWSINQDDNSWSRDDTDDMSNSGLETLNIYGLYWVRLSWSATMTGTTTLSYVGHKFSDDTDLEAQYPDLARSELKTAFKAGKTTWKDQALIAAENIIHDLIQRNVINNGSQIIEWNLFRRASTHQVAAIIFRAFGDDYQNDLIQALKDYKEAMDIKVFKVDYNKNAMLDDSETRSISSVLTR